MIKLTPQKPPYYENVTQTKIYKALITQSGTDAPTAIILKNTIGTIIWTRTSPGIYKGTLNNTFPKDSTFLIITPNNGAGTFSIVNDEDGEPSNSITIRSLVSFTPGDDNLYNTPIQIEI